MKIYFVFLRMDIGWTNRKIVPQTCNVTFLPDFNILPIHLLYIFLNRLFQSTHRIFQLHWNWTLLRFDQYLNLYKMVIFQGDFFFIIDIKWCCRLGILMQNVGQVSMTLDLSWRLCWKQQNLTSICLLVSLRITTRTTTLQGNILNLRWPKLIQLSTPNDIFW